MKALIVIPTYNERGNLEPLVTQILATAPEVDLLVIDDASQDGTGELADELHARLPQLQVLHRPGKLGLGTAYLRGFAYAMENGYELVFEMDADFSRARAGWRGPGCWLALHSRWRDARLVRAAQVHQRRRQRVRAHRPGHPHS